MADGKSGEVFIERHQIGNIMRVNAIDVATGIEVTFQAPANTSAGDIDRMAINKLKYVLEKQKK